MPHRQKLTHHFVTDRDGNPSGGTSNATGVNIQWQSGPLTGSDISAANGAFVETVVEAAIARLEFFQDSRFNCGENSRAIDHLKRAVEVLDARTDRRKQQGTEGTHHTTREDSDRGEPAAKP